MGKRGPKPSLVRMVQLGTRVSSSTRIALEDAARKNNKLLSREIEERLKRSFDEDRDLKDRLGGRQIYAILRTVAAALDTAGGIAFSTRHGKLPDGGEWLSDPYAYDQAMKAVWTILAALRPVGDIAPPTINQILRAHKKTTPKRTKEQHRAVQFALSRLGAHSASMILAQVEDAEPSHPPLEKIGTVEQRLARRIAVDLGPLQQRLQKRRKK